MMGNIDTFSDPNVELGTILGKVQAAGDVQANANLISGMLDAAGEIPLTEISQDNLVLGAVTLLLADAQAHENFDPDSQKEYLDEFTVNQEETPEVLTKKQHQALTLSAAAGGQDGALKEVLGVLHLK
jgi:hypothetical protein